MPNAPNYSYDIREDAGGRPLPSINSFATPVSLPDGWERIVSSVRHNIPGCRYESQRWSCQHREPQDQAALGPCVCQHCQPPVPEHFHYFTVEWDGVGNQRRSDAPPLIDPELSELPPNWVRITSSVRHDGCDYSGDTTVPLYERWSCHHVEPSDRAPSASCGCEHCQPEPGSPAANWAALEGLSSDTDNMSDALRRALEVASSGWANIPYRRASGAATAPIATPPGEVSYPNPDCPHPFRMIRCDFCGWENHCGFAPHDDQGPLCPRDGRGDSISWQEPSENSSYGNRTPRGHGVSGWRTHTHASGLVCLVPNCHDCLCLDCEDNR